MPVVDYKTYRKILQNAKHKGYALPSINVASYSGANAALEGFLKSRSDGIIQVSTGGASFISGQHVKDMVLGAVSLAEHVHHVADRYDIYVALHTDHCVPGKVDAFVRPLIDETRKRRETGQTNLYNGHMFDGSTLPLAENLKLSKELLQLCHQNEIILEIEIGAVGGEEDDVKADKGQKLYTNSREMIEVATQLGLGQAGDYILAATFGNVHGVYNPGVVKLKPDILREGQQAVQQAFQTGKNPFYLVFHGGSGSSLKDIHRTLEYGVIKMNVDTDTQYAFTRAIADHIMKHYEGVLKIDGNVGNKKIYDPRSYLKAAEENMTKRVMQACNDLKSTDQSMHPSNPT